MKGGHARSGPAPDPNALRRDRKSDAAGWTVLPIEGRKGDPPKWPLQGQSLREESLWQVFWAKPQALLWHRNQQVLEVAIHVRTFTEAEKPGVPASVRTLLRQQADALLLTIPAMHSARVRIAEDQVQAARFEREERKVEQAPRRSARERLKVANGGGA